MIANSRVFAYPFTETNTDRAGYWRDVGSIDAYYEASMDVVATRPPLDMYDAKWPIRTYHPDLPPAKFIFDEAETRRVGHAIDSIVCCGSTISGARVKTCVVGRSVSVHSFANIEESVLMDGVDVGRGCQIRRAILDEGVRVPANSKIGYDAASDRASGYHVSESGVVVVTG